MANLLEQKLREGGEKAVVGLIGYYALNYSDRYCVKKRQIIDDSPPYIKVKVVGFEMDGHCGTQFVVEPIGGVGAFLLDNPCRFVASKEEIKQLEDKRKAEEEKRKFINDLGSTGDHIRLRIEKTLKGLSKLTKEQRAAVADEFAAVFGDKVSFNDPDAWKHTHCARVKEIIKQVRYPSESNEEDD